LTITKILSTYASHPLTAKAIMARVGESNVRGRLTEEDLAFDPLTGITDQNHIAGAGATLRLAELSGIDPTDTIVDLACGLGGSIRLLASTYACRAHGIDFSSSRIEDARTLTGFVGLDHLVAFECADITRLARLPECSIVMAQNSWLHIEDPSSILVLVSNTLRKSGRFAFEEVCLRRSPASPSEQVALQELQTAWLGIVRPVDYWINAFAKAGLHVQMWEEELGLVPYLTELSLISRRAPTVWPEGERRGFEAGLHLGKAGVISYVRVLSFK
jgi:SAM-dependent methyltransferase